MKSLIRWDPFHMMRRWDPFEELRTMQKEMDRIFSRFLGGEREVEPAGLWVPSIDTYTKDGKLFVRAELPGIDPKDLDVTVTERELVIKGERKTEKDEKEKDYTYREISYGSFERRVLLPEGAKIDDLKAHFSNGILEISVPVPAVSKVRKVTIEAKEAKQLESEATAKKAA